jgi:hypothetical protein
MFSTGLTGFSLGTELQALHISRALLHPQRLQRLFPVQKYKLDFKRMDISIHPSQGNATLYLVMYVTVSNINILYC